MWVRTQSRKGLIDAICFTTSSCRIYADAIGFEDYVLGTYATEARTLEVLDEIQRHIITSKAFDFIRIDGNDTNVSDDMVAFMKSYVVYEMPKE